MGFIGDRLFSFVRLVFGAEDGKFLGGVGFRVFLLRM